VAPKRAAHGPAIGFRDGRQSRSGRCRSLSAKEPHLCTRKLWVAPPAKVSTSEPASGAEVIGLSLIWLISAHLKWRLPACAARFGMNETPSESTMSSPGIGRPEPDPGEPSALAGPAYIAPPGRLVSLRSSSRRHLRWSSGTCIVAIRPMTARKIMAAIMPFRESLIAHTMTTAITATRRRRFRTNCHRPFGGTTSVVGSLEPRGGVVTLENAIDSACSGEDPRLEPFLYGLLATAADRICAFALDLGYSLNQFGPPVHEANPVVGGVPLG